MTRELSLMVVGDIFIGPPRERPLTTEALPIRTERADLFSWLANVAPVLQQGDFTMGNLEGPICAGGHKDVSKAGTGGSTFNMPPRAAQALRRAGFDALSLANNHEMDMGPEALLETIAHLDKAGIAWAGGGRNIAEARRPAILECDGVRLAFLSYTSSFIPGTSPAGDNKPGLATVSISTAYEIPGSIRYAPGVPPRIITTADHRDAEQMQEDVRKAKTQADLVVVSWHWGLTRYANSFGMKISIEEAPFFVLNYQEDMGRAAVDAGADLIMGHHPHRLQGMEVYKGKLICYSLGNLVVTFGEGPNFATESAIVKAYVDPKAKQIIRLAFIPVMAPQETLEPYIVPIEDADDYVMLLTRLSKKYGTRFRRAGDDILIEGAL